jgi:hypothetical protein
MWPARDSSCHRNFTVFNDQLGGVAGAYFLVTLMGCIGLAISSLEYLLIAREFRQDGLFAWGVMASRPIVARYRSLFAHIQFIFEHRSLVAVNVIRLAACLALPWVLGDRALAFTLFLTVASISILISFRNFVGADGSDQMAVIIFVSLAIYTLTSDRFIQYAALLFIGAQCVLSYVVSGIAKAISPTWRSGVALRQIFRTGTYGVPAAERALYAMPQAINVALCWMVIVVESLFFLVIFLPWPVCGLFLAWGIVFHVGNAIVMGLNTFLWSFVAAYPAILVLNHWFALKM